MGKACQNTMETEENDRGDKYEKAQGTDSEWGGGGGCIDSPQWIQREQRGTKGKELQISPPTADCIINV